MDKVIGLLLATALGLTVLLGAPASAGTLATPHAAPVVADQALTTAEPSTVDRARYWSCTRIENEFVSIIGAWGANPALGPQVNTAVRTLITHVKNKVTKRLLRQVLLVQDPLAPDSSALFNSILTRVTRGQC